MNSTQKVVKFRGGVHPREGKELTASRELRIAPLLEKYIVPIRQSIGAPPTLCVKKGDAVKKGQRIAEPGGFVSVRCTPPPVERSEMWWKSSG